MRKITVAVPALTGSQREKLREKAASYGFETAFFEDNPSAYQDAATSEIIYGAGVDLAKAGHELKWMCASSAGVDMYCHEGIFHSEDVMLTNSKGSYGVTISEYIIMVTLMLLRKQLTYAALVRERKWEQKLPITSILGSRIVIVGTGNIGSEAAKRFRAFLPASIIGVNRSGKISDENASLFDKIVVSQELKQILPETDILVLCVPGTDSTRHLIDAKALDVINPNAVLINVGRGSSVDQNAVAEALQSGKLKAAALDVFEKEPIPQDDPIWDCPNLLITTHTSGNLSLPWTVEENLNLFLEDLDNYANGRKLVRLIDRKIGY